MKSIATIPAPQNIKRRYQFLLNHPEFPGQRYKLAQTEREMLMKRVPHAKIYAALQEFEARVRQAVRPKSEEKKGWFAGIADKTKRIFAPKQRTFRSQRGN